MSLRRYILNCFIDIGQQFIDIKNSIAHLLSERMSSCIWSVVFTHFSDDYKCRGDDWSTTEKPRLFSTKEKAEKYARKKLDIWIRDHIQGRDDFAELIDKDGELIGDPLELIESDLNKGEYVCRLIDCTITLVFLDEEDDSTESDRIREEQDEEGKTTEKENVANKSTEQKE